MDITHAQLVPVPNPALEMKKRKSFKERESIIWRIISNLTFFDICCMKLAFRRKQESLLKKIYENTPQWRHSFFDKCEFWERTLNLLVNQIFYCDILKPLALVLFWKMQDVWVLKSVFFMFWSRDLPHTLWLIKRDRGRTFKPLFNAFSNLCSVCYCFTSFNLYVGEFFWSWILKDVPLE